MNKTNNKPTPIERKPNTNIYYYQSITYNENYKA